MRGMKQPTTAKGLSVEQVEAALRQSGGSPTEAARLLGVTRNTVNYWMARGGLSRKIVLVKEDE